MSRGVSGSARVILLLALSVVNDHLMGAPCRLEKWYTVPVYPIARWPAAAPARRPKTAPDISPVPPG